MSKIKYRPELGHEVFKFYPISLFDVKKREVGVKFLTDPLDAKNSVVGMDVFPNSFENILKCPFTCTCASKTRATFAKASNW